MWKPSCRWETRVEVLSKGYSYVEVLLTVVKLHGSPLKEGAVMWKRFKRGYSYVEIL
jgi:hypothetical protein